LPRERKQTHRPANTQDPSTVVGLRDALRRFAADRDWDQFHSPKNLATALCVEAAELLEHFQWLSDDDSKSLSVEQLQKVQEEMGDVLLYLIRLADKLNVNLLDAAKNKINVNARKYPAAKARGHSRKYTEL
jgi:dCTP diphosphatase